MNDRVRTSSKVPARTPGSTGARRSRVSASCRGNTAPRYHPIRCPYSSPAPFASGSTRVGGARRRRTYCAEAGRHYLISRYYDPATGQFLSVDPEVQSTLEAFPCAADDPVNLTDPSGEAPQEGPPPACRLDLNDVVCIPVPFAFDSPYVAQALLSASNDAFPLRTTFPDGHARILDGYDRWLDLGYEFKIGRQGLTTSGIPKEIGDDVQLLAMSRLPGNPNPVQRIIWQFWPSIWSGTRPATSLVERLTSSNIGVEIFYYEPKANINPAFDPYRVVGTASVLGLLGGLIYAIWNLARACEDTGICVPAA